jgi:prepilin-type N-terminal cleavage/methylation domain-containing protein
LTPLQRTRAGFTLLEVLAATLIFSIVMVVLIGSSTEAVQRVGLSASRLEASALADRELARLESALRARLPPPEDYEETVDEFVIRVWSEPALEDLGGGAGAPATTRPSLDLSGDGGGVAALGPMIRMIAPGIEAFLLRYEIRVEWIEGVQPGSVGRTTYAFDWPGAQEALPDLFQQADPSGLGLGDPKALGGEAEALIDQLQGAGGR